MLNCSALAGDGASRRDPRPTVAIAAWPLLTAEQRASTAQILWGERARLVKGRSPVSQYSLADSAVNLSRWRMLLSVDLGPWNRASTGAAATVQRGALPGDLGEADSHWIATTIQPGPEKCSDLRRSLCPRQDSNLRPSAPEADALSPELRGRTREMLRQRATTD
jgi:hypothetical protein